MEIPFLGGNILAVLAAAISAFAVGGVWYGPLFGKAWMEAFNISEADIAEANMVKIYGFAFLLTLLPAWALEIGFGAGTDGWLDGLRHGLLAGVVFVAAFTGIQYLFESRPLQAFLINAGYSVLALTVMGIVTGLL